MSKVAVDNRIYNLDKFMEYGTDLVNRILYLGSADYDLEDGGETGVDFKMAERLIKGLIILDADAPNGDKPITIIMNNLGGDWYHGMAIYDAIRDCKNPVIIKAYGYAMSMGSVILQAADERLITPNCRFMIHYGTDGYESHSKITGKWADEGKRVNHDMENIYLERLWEKDEKNNHDCYLENKMSEVMTRLHKMEYPEPKKFKFKFSTKDLAKRKDDIREVLQLMLNFDTILTAKETVELGFADEVSDPDA